MLPLLLGACANAPPQAPPAPERLAAVPDDLPPYRLQVGDLLDIRLQLNPELNDEVVVRPDGRISTQLAEGVRAAGRTPEELAAELRRIYGQELRDPRLAVVVKNFMPSRIYVAGEVASPGEFQTTGPELTLAQAVARAGGLRVTADAGSILILRRGADDRPLIFRADYRRATAGTDPAADVRLAPYDVVFVPRTEISDVYVWFNQHVQQFVPVSWGFSYNVNPVVNNTTH
jgi:polysaccharide biosynthesis/export protein